MEIIRDRTMLANLPESIAGIITNSPTPETMFTALMPAIGEFLQVDRCFLYLRDPQTSLGKVPFCWCRTSAISTIYNHHWSLEPELLASADPMFAAALRTEPTIFIEDVNTTSDRILSRQFERENFGHRALIHAHLCQDDRLWGVLQPCIFARSRKWTQIERQTIERIVKLIIPIAVQYVIDRRVSVRYAPQ
jgi:GAF domain-containing protein